MESIIPSREALCLIFLDMLRDPAIRSTRCIIDGLDECVESSIFWLRERIMALTSDDNLYLTHPFRLLIVSRKLVGFEKLPTVDLDGSMTSGTRLDVLRFIDYCLNSISGLHGFDGKLRDRVFADLAMRCEGSLLWLSFVVQCLVRKKTCSDVEAALKTFPSGLGPLYNSILSQILMEHPDYLNACAAVLRWAVNAMEPISLPELAVVLQIHKTPLISVDQAVRDCVTRCELLVRLENLRLIPVHLSLSVHLTTLVPSESLGLETFHFDLEEAHPDMAQTCLKYLEKGPAEEITWTAR
jgi:hypothetical protein